MTSRDDVVAALDGTKPALLPGALADPLWRVAEAARALNPTPGQAITSAPAIAALRAALADLDAAIEEKP